MDFKNFRRDMMRALVGGGMLATAFTNVAQAPAQDMAQLPTTPPISDEFENAADIQGVSAYQEVLEKLAGDIADKDGGRFTSDQILAEKGHLWEREIRDSLKANRPTARLGADIRQELDLDKYTTPSISVNYSTMLDLVKKTTTPLKVYDGRRSYERKAIGPTGNATGTLQHGVTKP